MIIRLAAASLLLGVVLMGAASRNPPESSTSLMAISVLTVPCARDSSIPPEVRITDVATLEKPVEVRIDRQTIRLTDGAYETRFRLPAGQYVVDVASTNCAQPYSPLDLTVVDGHGRHLFVQTVQGKAVMRTGLYGLAVIAPPGIPIVLERIGTRHSRRPVQDDGIFYFENLTEGQYLVLVPFGVNTVCEKITVSAPAVVLNIGREQIVAALKRAKARTSGECQAWIKNQGQAKNPAPAS